VALSRGRVAEWPIDKAKEYGSRGPVVKWSRDPGKEEIF